MKGWKSVRLRVIAYRRGAETSCNWARALWPLVYRRGNWIIHWAVSSSKSLDPHHYEESGWGWQWWLRGSSTMARLIKDSLWLPNPLVRYQQTTCGFAQFGISYFEQQLQPKLLCKGQCLWQIHLTIQLDQLSGWLNLENCHQALKSTVKEGGGYWQTVMVCQLKVIGRPLWSANKRLLADRSQNMLPVYQFPLVGRPLMPCTKEQLLQHPQKICDNSSSTEKDCLYQRNQIFQTPSLAAKMVTAPTVDVEQ